MQILFTVELEKKWKMIEMARLRNVMELSNNQFTSMSQT